MSGDGPWPALLEALPYRKDDVDVGVAPVLRLAGGRRLRRCAGSTSAAPAPRAASRPTSTRRPSAATSSTVIDWLATQPWSAARSACSAPATAASTRCRWRSSSRPRSRRSCRSSPPTTATPTTCTTTAARSKQLDVVDYPTYMVAMNALPPVPALWGEGWREEWQRRLEQTEPWFLTWLAHQHRDEYWRYGSVREDIDRIRAATMIVGGWADGYTNIALRSFPRMQAPTRLLLGPWSHGAPETCRPGPNIDFTAELLRWFDRWLKDVDNGIDREPPIVVYQQRSTEPDPLRSDGARRVALRADLAAGAAASNGRSAAGRGHRRTAPATRSRSVATSARPRGSRARADFPGGSRRTSGPTRSARSPTPGSRSGRPRDLRAPAAPGARHVRSADRVRLGEGHRRVPRRRVLARRAWHGEPRAARHERRGDPGDAGEPIELDLELEAIAWTFEAGHRIRLDLAGADWPNAWPPPYAATLAFDRRRRRAGTAGARRPPTGRRDPDIRAVVGQPARHREHRGRLVALGGRARSRHGHAGRRAPATAGSSEPDDDTFAYRDRYEGVVGVSPEDPGVAFAEGEGEFEIGYPEATVRTTSRVRLRLRRRDLSARRSTSPRSRTARSGSASAGNGRSRATCSSGSGRAQGAAGARTGEVRRHQLGVGQHDAARWARPPTARASRRAARR